MFQNGDNIVTISNISDQSHLFSKSYYILGTIISLKVCGINGEKVIDEAMDRLTEIDDKMSVFKVDSEITRINKNAGKLPQAVSTDTFYVIHKAISYSQLSEGAFDPTVRPIMNLWGIGTDHPKVPENRIINKAIKIVSYTDIILNENGFTVKLNHENQAIDLGAIAKGYAADEVKDIFLKNNVENAIIDLGGNVYVLGNTPDGEMWNVGIQDPLKQRGKVVGVIGLSNKSVVTSGGYERYFEEDGEIYHHIIDPRTGYPCTNGIISVTIISDFSIDGDALSTCTYIMGLDKGLDLIESINGVEAIIIDKDNEIYTTSGIKKN